MDTVEDVNWQAKATIRERNKFMFNNKLLSDVKFIVQRDGYESNSCEGSNSGKLIIPAHKFVLSISSPVFFAMFYGEMPEAEDSIYLPDCEYESLLELFRFMYSDEVNLTGSNVMEVLYLAKKYIVPSLVDKCTEYLQQNLGPSNAFCILSQAQRFEEKDLEESCWNVIDNHTEEALKSSEFATIDKSSIASIVKRDSLNIKEIELFKAVDRWATCEAEKQGLTPDGAVKRNILGEDIIKGIRFPVMSLKEFASVVPDSNILTTTELADMIKYYGGVSMAPVLFSQTARRRRGAIYARDIKKNTAGKEIRKAWVLNA